MISRRAAALGVSKTTASRAHAERLKASGMQIANLSAGELDLLPPRSLTQSIAELANTDIHRYTPTAGTSRIRAHVANYIVHTREIPVERDNVVMTAGAKHGLFEALYCLTEPGDEVLIPVPAWGTFVKQAEISGARVVKVETHPQTFFPDLGTLERNRTERTRVVMLNSPHNPTGSVYPDELVLEIAQWAKRHGITVIMDESYIDLYYTERRPSHIRSLDPGLDSGVVTVGSFSKALAITGWRAGYVYGPDNVIKAVTALQSHIASNPTSLCQMALEKTPIKEIDDFTRHTREILRMRRDLVQSALKPVETLDFAIPLGAFYFYVNARKYLEKQTISIDTLTGYLLESGVSVTSGSAFGSDTHFRISYAVQDDELKSGLSSIAAAMRC